MYGLSSRRVLEQKEIVQFTKSEIGTDWTDSLGIIHKPVEKLKDRSEGFCITIKLKNGIDRDLWLFCLDNMELQ